MTVENIAVGKLYVVGDTFPTGLAASLAVKDKRLVAERDVGHDEWTVLDVDVNEVLLAPGSTVLALSVVGRNGAQMWR